MGRFGLGKRQGVGEIVGCVLGVGREEEAGKTWFECKYVRISQKEYDWEEEHMELPSVYRLVSWKSVGWMDDGCLSCFFVGLVGIHLYHPRLHKSIYPTTVSQIKFDIDNLMENQNFKLSQI